MGYSNPEACNWCKNYFTVKRLEITLWLVEISREQKNSRGGNGLEERQILECTLARCFIPKYYLKACLGRESRRINNIIIRLIIRTVAISVEQEHGGNLQGLNGFAGSM